MSDTHQRYCAIKAALRQVIAVVPDSHSEKHLNTLTALICGLVGAQHSHLPKLADHAPSQGAKRESRIERFERWLRHREVNQTTYFMPFARAVLAALAAQPLVFIMAGSSVGRWSEPIGTDTVESQLLRAADLSYAVEAQGEGS